ncbi:MAG: hypothetical protein ACFCAD_15415 [Pleurocapsa sp.]
MFLLQLFSQINSNSPAFIDLARWTPPLLAFFIAYLFTILELITSKYPRTSSFIIKKQSLHIYGIIYGFFAFFIVFVLDTLIESGSVKIEGLGLSNPWWKAVLIGIGTKGFLKIKLFTVNAGSYPFPVGIDSIVQIFEPWLLRTIELNEFNEVRNYVENKVNQYSNLSTDEIKAKITNNIPGTLKENEKKLFEYDLKEKKESIDAMELYLTRFGKETLERVFPDFNP